MNVLVCGARGFVGRNVVAALRRNGHQVVEGVSAGRKLQASDIAVTVDYAHDVDPAVWLPRLKGVDAVVNAVGILRDSARGPMSAVHDRVPSALFEACAQAGVRRVVQVSALGVDQSNTAYASTKRAADDRLAALTREGRLEGVSVRPSIVFGPGGASSSMFLSLSRLPVIVLPGPMRRAVVQPIAVDELATGIAALLQARAEPGGEPRVIAAVGPVPLTLDQFIASLRAQAGHGPARLFTLPDLLTRLTARAGDALPFSPWCSETLALLGIDNVAPPQAFERLLGHPARRYDRLLQPVRS